MGSSTRYSSASDKPADEFTFQGPPMSDTSGSSPISAKDTSADLLRALARVDQSLRVVLLAIHEIQREMGIKTPPTPDVPLKPDDSWVGTP